MLANGTERSSKVRLAAVMALRDMGRPSDKAFDQAIEALNKAHKDPDRSVEIWAVVALMTLEDKASEERLSEVARYLKGKDTMVKVTAATALGALGDRAKSRIPDIIDLLDDPDPIAMAAAIDVLRGFGKAAVKAVPDLRKIMLKKGQLDYFRGAAAKAITDITGKEEKVPERPATPASSLTQEKRLDPKEVGGKTLAQWIAEIRNNPDPSMQETAMGVVPYFGTKAGSRPRARCPAAQHGVPRHRLPGPCHPGPGRHRRKRQRRGRGQGGAPPSCTRSTTRDSRSALPCHRGPGGVRIPGESSDPEPGHRTQDPNSWELRQAAIASLRTIASGDSTAPPDGRAVVAIANRLLGETWDKTAQVRVAAVMSLGAMGRPVQFDHFLLSKQALTKATKDPDKSVQIWAQVALMAVDRITKEGLAAVAWHLGAKEKDGMAKVTAMRALEAMGKEARPRIGDIIDLVDDSDPLIAATAIDVLGQLGSVARDAVPALRKVMEKKDQSESFKDAAKAAIELIDGPPPKVKKG